MKLSHSSSLIVYSTPSCALQPISFHRNLIVIIWNFSEVVNATISKGAVIEKEEKIKLDHRSYITIIKKLDKRKVSKWLPVAGVTVYHAPWTACPPGGNLPQDILPPTLVIFTPWGQAVKAGLSCPHPI